MPWCTYVARPSQTGCENNLQLHHATGERHAHHSCIDLDFRHASPASIQMSYRKAWLAKQMAMEQLYNDWDTSYNEL